MENQNTTIALVSKLKAIAPQKAKLILSKLKEESQQNAACQWRCNGHNQPKHNKLF